MKTPRHSYLFILNHSSAEAAKHAIEACRRLNLRVPARFGDRALEVVATSAEAQAAFALGIFSTMAKGTIGREHLKDLEKGLQPFVKTWNARFSRPSRRAKEDHPRLGQSWTRKTAPALYTRFDITEVMARLQVELKRRKITFGGKEGGKRTKDRKAPKELEKGDFKKAREFFHKQIKDKPWAEEIGRLYRRADPDSRRYFLDLEVLKLIFDILLHLAAAEEPGCLKMHGSNSIAIVFVESSRANGPTFGTDERNDIENEIRSGLSWLVSEHPDGNLTWIYDVQQVRIDVADDANLDDSSTAYDAYWRHPAMAEVEFEGHTFSGDDAGIDVYRTALRAHHGSQHATVVFVSAFGTSWHGYSLGRQFVALSEHGNNWGGWGLGMMNIIAAHEICHQFGAADEYDDSDCECDGENGCDKIPNGNCELCARPHQDCLMSHNKHRICDYTRGQIGWSDIFVELFTDDDWWSGTDDDVELDIGHRTFTLDNSGHNDRETNNREGYAIWAGGNLSRSDIKRILIRKSSDGPFGGWKLHRLRVFHNGDVICDTTPDVWLEGRKRWFLASTFDTLLVNELKIRVSTGDVWWAGTDDNVTLKLAGHSWDLDTDANDFERGESSTFDLDPQTGLGASSVNTIAIEKSPDGPFGGWRLGGLRLTVNGSQVYDKQSINRWLEGNDRTFSDGI